MSRIEYLRSDQASVRFSGKGHLGEASKAIEPVLTAFETTDVKDLPVRMSKTFREQTEIEIRQLRRAGLKRVIRITAAELYSKQTNGNFGFTRWIDASREWRECEICATVLEQYIDVRTGECVIENYDEGAWITIRQSRHISAADQKKYKNSKAEIYSRDHYICPSCGGEIEHVADQTNCPFCGAFITFNFFDWQLDSFYLDIHKSKLLDGVKNAAASAVSNAAAGGVVVALKAAELMADAWDRADEKLDDKTGTGTSFGNYIGAIFVVLFIIFMIGLSIFANLPYFVRVGLGIAVLGYIIYRIIKHLQNTAQDRKKKKIVRYSDGFLRSCVYDVIWKEIDTRNLIDFSIDDIIINSVNNTERTTTIEVVATVIKKYINDERQISIVAEDVTMKLSRARYPDKIKNKGKVFEEKECPSCGSNFMPDEHHCCSYCGYGLRMENFVWRKES